MPNIKEKIVLEWNALEEKKDQNTWLWMIAIIIASGVAIGYGFYKKEWLMGAAFIMALLVVSWTLLSKTQPLRVSITTTGIWVGKNFHDFAKIKGYWFSERKKTIYLEQKARVGITSSFPTGDVDIEKIKNSLPDYLVEIKEREEDWVDHLSKKLHI